MTTLPEVLSPLGLSAPNLDRAELRPCPPHDWGEGTLFEILPRGCVHCGLIARDALLSAAKAEEEDYDDWLPEST